MVFNGSSVSPSAGRVIDEAAHPVEFALLFRTVSCISLHECVCVSLSISLLPCEVGSDIYIYAHIKRNNSNRYANT